jgi:hypothetical protein
MEGLGLKFRSRWHEAQIRDDEPHLQECQEDSLECGGEEKGLEIGGAGVLSTDLVCIFVMVIMGWGRPDKTKRGGTG